MKIPCSRPGDASNIKAGRKQFSPGFPQSAIWGDQCVPYQLLRFGYVILRAGRLVG